MSRRSRWFLLLGLVTALAAGAAVAWYVQDERKWALPTVLSRAERVEVFRVYPESSGPVEEPQIGGLKIVSTGGPQGKDFARRLSEVLIRARGESGPMHACFWPGVAFRLECGGDRVEAFICFFCNNFALRTIREDGRIRGTGIITFSEQTWDDLLALSREALPEDTDLKELTRETRQRHLDRMFGRIPAEGAPGGKP
jgi:hypothetical protein